MWSDSSLPISHFERTLPILLSLNRISRVYAKTHTIRNFKLYTIWDFRIFGWHSILFYKEENIICVSLKKVILY